MEPVILLSVAVALLLFGSISRRAERSVLTPPLWFVLVGFGLNRLGLIDLALTGEGIRVLAELALVLVLFTDAARIDLACLRTMAKAQGVSPGIVHRIWQAHGLQPHRVETFKLSQDPDFVKKLRDVVGMYLHPPAKALVFCVDEKPQVQALDRTEPVLPLRPGSARRARAGPRVVHRRRPD